ncbi:TetR-like C-terminal domain-containing protein [Streptomyces mobaraensis]|uniref:TetR-like C-terminal domain-containing protein n=1 Tax=Streptomyces mobaraensis TaxID=35621 RepID=UPI003320931B
MARSTTKATTKETVKGNGRAGRGPDPRAERSRAAALAAASDLLIEGGWAQVTHVAVAARSGVGRTTLYRHWPEAAMLIQELLADIFSVNHSERTGDLRSDLRSEVGVIAEMLCNPKQERALRVIIDQAPLDPRYAEVLESCTRKGMSALREILAEGSARGELPESLDIDVAVDRLIGPLVFRRLAEGGDFTGGYVDELVDDFLRAQAAKK